MSKTPLTTDRLRELARTGADVTLKRLRAEIIAIERAFPELRLAQGRRAAGEGEVSPATVGAEPRQEAAA